MRTSRHSGSCALAAASFAFFVVQGIAYANCVNSPCVPGPGEVCIFQNGECGAPYVRVPIGTVWDTLGGPGKLPNDSISEILVGPNTEALLCSDANFGAVCETFRSGGTGFPDPCYYLITRKRVYWYGCCQANEVCNDWTSSLKVYLKPDTDVVSCYSQPPPRTCSFITSSLQCNILPEGAYPNPASTGLPNDSIIGVNCGAYAAAYVYKDDNFMGGSYASPYYSTSFNGPPAGDVSSIYVVRTQ